MFEKNMKYAYLTDIYGGLLDEHARGQMEAYYNEDLSLSEIAEGSGISRQGVRANIKKCEELLDHYEDVLGLLCTSGKLTETVERLEALAQAATFSSLTQEEMARQLTDIATHIKSFT